MEVGGDDPGGSMSVDDEATFSPADVPGRELATDTDPERAMPRPYGLDIAGARGMRIPPLSRFGDVALSNDCPW